MALGDIVKLAPLLFAIVAELSLAEREEMINNLHSLSEYAEKALPQLNIDCDPESIEREEESIERREVFAWRHWDYREGEGLDPFARCLKGLMPGNLAIPLRDGQGGAPGYDLEGLTRELLGLKLNPDDDKSFWQFLWSDEIGLRDVYAKKTGPSPEAFQEWLSAELARIRDTHALDTYELDF